MPTVLRIDGFRFFFFSDEHEPVHIHVEKGDGYMRVELETLNVTAKQKFTKNDEKKIISIIKKHQEELIGAWNAHFHQ
ncbi:DUF4160 domain-containing protein [Sulfurospirillum sp. T05]|uniref:DUF4160 domain-containing protein n=1 Tax=Sulfurospirillum tamanense TaxID=2813362 RepID=A0ABS2WW22_9BACT|nr:DUF4160 domain-containing protein [Sulfurospirillum tamanensis]MBN2965588.1 DUF4160 domain-containing protein [Sulfurospirillum tamanensis]